MMRWDMDAANQRLETLFDDALEISDPAARAAFLARECAGDDALQSRVERLLAAHAQAAPFFDDCRPALQAAGPDDSLLKTKPVEEETGRSIGPYKLLQKIGEGGCGVSIWPSRKSRCAAGWR